VSLGFIRIRGFLNPAECLAIREAMDVGAKEDAEVLARGIHRHSLVRHASLVEPPGSLIEAIEVRLDSCRDRVAEALGLGVGDREGAGFIRYPEGGFYRAHRDRGDDPEWADAARRAVALVLFLNSSRDASPDGDFEGGVLRLFGPDGTIDVLPEAGTLVAFPADVLHEVTEVRDGTRDTVVDWFYDVSGTSA
jgi:predicted 2-oxoglutarate/Fe(II)-dependent dioxygenase YbiX